MDYPALKADIAVQVAAGSFQSTDSDSQIADWYNAATIDAQKDVPIGDVEGYLGLMGTLQKMKDWVTDNPTPSVTRTAVAGLFRTLSSPHVKTFQMSDPTKEAAIKGMMDELVTATLLPADQEATLLAMCATKISRAQQLGLGPLTHIDVNVARAS